MTSTIESQATRSAARTSKKWGRKRTIAVVSAAVILGGSGTAWAAYQLFGFGQIKTDIAVTKGLTVNNSTAKLTKQLVPGQTAGATVEVTNPNDFPVTVTGVITSVKTLKIDGTAKDCLTTVKLVGAAGTYPGEGGGDGVVQAIKENVVIAPGSTGLVTVPEYVKQDGTSTGLCTIQADFAVKGQTAS